MHSKKGDRYFLFGKKTCRLRSEKKESQRLRIISKKKPLSTFLPHFFAGLASIIHISAGYLVTVLTDQKAFDQETDY